MDWDEIDREIAAKNAAMNDSVDPAKSARRLAETRALAVREGWSDEDGNSLLGDDDDDDDDDGDES